MSEVANSGNARLIRLPKLVCWGGEGRRNLVGWHRGLVFLCGEKEGSLASLLTPDPLLPSTHTPFLGHPYPARLALLEWGREEEKKAVVKLF